VRAPWITETLLAEQPDVIALQEFDDSQLGFELPGYTFLPGRPAGVSRHPKWIVRGAPIALLLWYLAWRELGPPPWSFGVTLLHALLFTAAVLAPLALFALILYRGPFRAPGEFLPILYRPDRLQPVDEGMFWFSHTPAKPSAFRLLFEPRATHWARFRPLAGGPEFLFMNTHLGHAPWHYAGSARLLLDLIARFDGPVVLVGDFNAVPESGVLKRLRAVLRDVRVDAPVSEGPDATFQWNLAPTMTPLRLDHVLYRGFAAERARVLTPRRDGRAPSDHDPLVVDFAGVGSSP
jgi:endonuclease/exonuclease/phosphatase family metal-dependent hydrolase